MIDLVVWCSKADVIDVRRETDSFFKLLTLLQLPPQRSCSPDSPFLLRFLITLSSARISSWAWALRHWSWKHSCGWRSEANKTWLSHPFPIPVWLSIISHSHNPIFHDLGVPREAERDLPHQTMPRLILHVFLESRHAKYLQNMTGPKAISSLKSLLRGIRLPLPRDKDVRAINRFAEVLCYYYDPEPSVSSAFRTELYESSSML